MIIFIKKISFKKISGALLILTLVTSGCSKFRKNPQPETETPEEKPVEEQTIQFRDEREAAIFKARKLYEKLAAEKTNFSAGPCISNEIIPDWVADIANNPREEIDNLAENQCEAYRGGQAHHFVELDKNGNLIRAL